jgi:predicted nucleotidyltransferase
MHTTTAGATHAATRSTMRRDEAIRIIEAHREDLSRFDLRSLSIFGSVARDEAGPDSDLDVLVEFGGTATFDGYMDLLEYLEALLGTRVDLVTARGLRPRLREYVERELIRVA